MKSFVPHLQETAYNVKMEIYDMNVLPQLTVIGKKQTYPKYFKKMTLRNQTTLGYFEHLKC